MYLLKMMFFADRYHIRHFGFVASGDTYVAMKRGPVGSATMDILRKQMPRQANSTEMSLLDDVSVVSENDVEIAKQDDDELSKSFIRSLDFALKTYGDRSQLELSAITHDYPEWKKHETAINSGTSGTKSIPMDFKDFFDNPETLKYSKTDPFTDDKDFLRALKDDFSGQSSC
ncbi:Panacea domain-containing protein [Candidatus Endomicrobiellum pyrsonymphae]|uniref:Panacea domain-containing protein n=1 Tax=Candidatus Endomicrobiellum pyrsonymphae TaxID=1408203 RepID=UPI0035A920F5